MAEAVVDAWGARFTELESWLVGLNLTQMSENLNSTIAEVQSMRRRLVASEGKVNSLESSVMALTSRLTTVESCAAMGTSSPGKQSLRISSAKTLHDVPKYNGQPDDFENWAFSARQFLGDLDPKYLSLLKLAEKSDDMFDEMEVQDWARDNGTHVDTAYEMCRQVWSFLVGKTVATCGHILTTLEHENLDIRGLLA